MGNVTIRLTVSVEATVNHKESDLLSMVSMRLPNGVNILPLFRADKDAVANVMGCIADAVHTCAGDEDP